MQHQFSSNFYWESPKKIKVLHVISNLNRGGIECWLMNLLRLKDPELDFHFLVFAEGLFDDEAGKLGATIHRLPFRRPCVFRHGKEIEKVLAENNFDVVHYHLTDFSGIAMKIAKRSGVPIRIDHSHNSERGGGHFWINGAKRFYRRFIDLPRVRRCVTSLLACSREAGRFSFGESLWEAMMPSEMVYCGIPTGPFKQEFDKQKRRNLCKKYGIPDDAIVAGTLGRLTYQKNHGFLLKVFSELAKRDKRYTLFVGGEGNLRQDLENQVSALSLTGRVFFPGVCTDGPDLMCHLFDVFCLPSRFEGLPVVLMESTAAGLHAVCSDVITRDILNAAPECFTSLSLSVPFSTWCDAIESGIVKRRAPVEGVRQIEKTSFTVENSIRMLKEIYRG